MLKPLLKQVSITVLDIAKFAIVCVAMGAAITLLVPASGIFLAICGALLIAIYFYNSVIGEKEIEQKTQESNS